MLLVLAPDLSNDWLADLRSAQFDVVTVSRPDAALDALADDEFDLLLLDLALPEALETAQLYRFLSLDCRSIPIVGLTARGSEMDERHGGTLDTCLPIDAGSSARAAIESMFPDRAYKSPARETPSSVVDFADYRASRGMRA